MAMLTVCAVLDKAAEVFMRPFFVVHEGVAKRDFIGECQNPESIIHKHAEDFSLYKFGTFDDNSGVFDLLREPQLLLAANGLGRVQPTLNLEDQK